MGELLLLLPELWCAPNNPSTKPSSCSPLAMTLSLPSMQATARKAPLGDTAMEDTPPQPAGKGWSVAP